MPTGARDKKIGAVKVSKRDIAKYFRHDSQVSVENFLLQTANGMTDERGRECSAQDLLRLKSLQAYFCHKGSDGGAGTLKECLSGEEVTRLHTMEDEDGHLPFLMANDPAQCSNSTAAETSMHRYSRQRNFQTNISRGRDHRGEIPHQDSNKSSAVDSNGKTLQAEYCELFEKLGLDFMSDVPEEIKQ